MDDIYLVEIRLAMTKWRIGEIVSSLGRIFSIDNYLEPHPHLTLFGPLSLKADISSGDLIEAVGRVATQFDPVSFIIGGWELRKGSHGSVIAFSVQPSDQLRALTTSLAELLSNIALSHNLWDANPDSKWFHVTIANRMDDDQASKIYASLTDQVQKDRSHGLPLWLGTLLGRLVNGKAEHMVQPVPIDETGLRITIMRGEKIFAEYDLLEKCWIGGDYSHDTKSWQTTLARYRQHSGFELLDPRFSHPDDIFLISDLHFGHANIIRYCSRPFLHSDVKEMDHVLIKNWNYTISPANRVYYLGDLRYGLQAMSALEYRKKLKGNITFIEGNHDDPELCAVPSAILDYGGFHFLLIHDPAKIPKTFDGWVIHGHHHNNDLPRYPFIDFLNRRVNVSAEAIGYIPVNLNTICNLIRERMSEGKTEPVFLSYRYGSEK